jgi:hypothetical protein
MESTGPVAGFLQDQLGLSPLGTQIGLTALGALGGIPAAAAAGAGVFDAFSRGIANARMADEMNRNAMRNMAVPIGLAPAEPGFGLGRGPEGQYFYPPLEPGGRLPQDITIRGIFDPETAPPGQPGPPAVGPPAVDITGALSGPPAEPPTDEPGEEGDAGEGGGDDSVICGELHRQCLMTDQTYERDQAFGRLVPADVRAGYLVWAPTVVSWMRRSRIMTWLVAAIARPWAREMAYGDSRIGRVIMAVGWVVCARLGRRVSVA